jgi:OOP family OmpA-OmpF porin
MTFKQVNPNSLSIVWFCFVAAAFCLFVIPPAQAQDLEGSQDHPLVSRYKGSYIGAYDMREYDRFVLALGKPMRNAPGERVAEKSQELEGRVTRILYGAPEARSTFEIFRNYEMALQGAGFKTLYKCLPPACGRYSDLRAYVHNRKFTKKRRHSSGLNLLREIHFLAAKVSTETGSAYVSLLVAMDPMAKYPSTLLEVVETKEMDTGMVTVNADTIGEGLAATGHMAIYGVYFDTGSAEIKPESASTLSEIAKLLAQKPELKLLVVGHTDNQGGYDFNMDLSRRRTASVVKALVSNHGIAEGRLRAAGVGYLAPVATNRTEEGRAKNRRVELVEQ